MQSATKTQNLWWLLIETLIVNIGTSFVWPLTTVYIHNYLGQSLTTAGFVLLLDSGAMVLGNYVGGVIYDRVENAKPYLVCAIFLNMVLMGLLAVWHSWPWFAVFLIIDGFFVALSSPLINALATCVKGYESRVVFNLSYFTLNVGVVVGTALVGLVEHIGINLIFLICSIMFGLGLLVVIFGFKFPDKSARLATLKEKHKQGDGGLKTTGFARQQILVAILLYFVIQFGYSQWQSNLSVRMGDLGISLTDYSLLWTLNGILILVFQPLLSWWDAKQKPNLQAKLYWGATFFIGGLVLLVFAKAYLIFILAMVLTTLGEVVLFPALPTYIDDRSTRAEVGKYQGLLTAAASLGHAVGPLTGSWLILTLSYQGMFGVMAALIAVAVLVVVGQQVLERARR